MVGRRGIPDARGSCTAGFSTASIVGFARSAGWLSMYVGLPWAHERAARLASAGAERLAATPGVTLLTPRERMSTLVSFRVAGWTAAEVVEVLGRRAHAIVRSIPGLDAVRLCVAFFNSHEALGRVLDAVEDDRHAQPMSLPRRPAIAFVEGQGSDPRARRRGWRDAAGARSAGSHPRRAGGRSSGAVAAVLGVAFLARPRHRGGRGDAPGGDLRTLAGVAFVAAVAILGAWLTYLAVPQPGRPGSRSAWSAALGLLAALPIAYLALVLLFQVLKPFLVGRG